MTPLSVLFFFLFLFRFFFALGRREDVSSLFPAAATAAFRRRRFRFRRELFVGRCLLDYWCACSPAAMRSRGRGFFSIALIRSALRTYGNRLAEVIKLRVATVTSVLSSEVCHAARHTSTGTTLEQVAFTERA